MDDKKRVDDAPFSRERQEQALEGKKDQDLSLVDKHGEARARIQILPAVKQWLDEKQPPTFLTREVCLLPIRIFLDERCHGLHTRRKNSGSACHWKPNVFFVAGGLGFWSFVWRLIWSQKE